MAILVAFPSDPLIVYQQKGEIKPRYYNPEDIFDEVHLVTPADQEVSPSQVRCIAGRAKLFIHPIGRPNPLRIPQQLLRARSLVEKIRPDVVRGYGLGPPGLQAVVAARHARVPVIISVHGNSDEDLANWLRRGRIPKNRTYLQQRLWYKLFQRYVLTRADRVICVYKFAERYARRHGARDPLVIYNRVDTDRFVPLPDRPRGERPLVLSVNQQIEVKDPEPLLRAVQGLAVDLLLIGDGPLHSKLTALADELALNGKVRFVKAVPHAEIHRYYQQADIFVNPMQCGGVAQGTMEAMACGLPVVHARPLWEDKPEVLEDLAVLADPNPEGFRAAIKQLLDSPGLRAELAIKNRERMEQLSGRQMERQECDLYTALIGVAQPALACQH